MADQPDNPFTTIPKRGSSEFHKAVTGRRETQNHAVNRFTPLSFSGTAKQLFGIQFVNILLITLTLGIWIPWARVRRRRFFYNNTRILGDGLDYLATGFQIFKGWALVTVTFLALYALPFTGVPFLQEFFFVVLMFVYPWALNRSLRYNARNIAWRDVRFDFTGSYLGSFWNLFIFPSLGVVTLGLLLPMASKSKRDYIARCYRFGDAKFASDSALSAYYGAGLKTLALILILSIPLIVELLLVTNISSNFTPILSPLIFENFTFFSVILIFLITTRYYHALTRNIMVRSLRLQGGIRFNSSLSGFRLAWITVSNVVVGVLFLGLLFPWAQVRLYRYLTAKTEIRPVNDMQGFVDKQVDAGHSIGDAIGEADGLDINI